MYESHAQKIAMNTQPNADQKDSVEQRRKFLRLGLASGAVAIAAATGCAEKTVAKKQESKQEKGSSKRPEQGVDIEKWRSIKGKDYELGSGPAPGVCQLPGPNAKKNWPDVNKYKNVKTVPGMCQLCSTVCGTIGYVKEGRLIKRRDRGEAQEDSR